MLSDQDRSGKRYELLVQEIFHALVNQNEVQNIEVRQNVTLKGKTTTHQIDVYWEFERGSIAYRTVVQAKDWAAPVEQGELIKFKGVLDDLQQQPRGVFVTRTGYQEGARQFAQAHGIALYELSEKSSEPNLQVTTLGWIRMKAEIRRFEIPTDDNGQVKEELAMRINQTVFQPRYSSITFEFDKAWFDENPLTKEIDKSKLKFEPLPLSEITLYDDQQRAIGNLEMIVRQELEVIKEENVKKKRVIHAFDQPTFLGPDTTNLPYIKMNKVVFDIEIETTHRTGRFNLKNFVQFALREIPDGTPTWFIKPKG